MSITKKANKNKKEWICDECHTKYRLKRDLVECLKEHMDEAGMTEDTCVNQLEDMGIENPWK